MPAARGLARGGSAEQGRRTLERGLLALRVGEQPEKQAEERKAKRSEAQHWHPGTPPGEAAGAHATDELGALTRKAADWLRHRLQLVHCTCGCSAAKLPPRQLLYCTGTPSGVPDAR
jgi:hypothetical protein